MFAKIYKFFHDLFFDSDCDKGKHLYLYDIERDINIKYVDSYTGDNEYLSFNYRPCEICEKVVKFKFHKYYINDDIRVIDITPLRPNLRIAK